MIENEPEQDAPSWVRRHLEEIGVTAVTGAAITAGFASYRHYHKRRKNLAHYLTSDLLELANTNPSDKAQLRRSVTAAVLTRRKGIVKADIQKLVTPGSQRPIVGPVMFDLVGAHILERVRSAKSQMVAPHADFLTAIATYPAAWEPILTEAQQLDGSFVIAQFLAAIALPDINDNS